MQESLDLRCGEVVRVRSEAEILATLDERGELEGLPFMPEMRRFCGRTLSVHRRADKTCDTISGETRALRMMRTVHLANVHCDGASHGGCQASCLIFWKEAWLERVDAPQTHPLWSLVAADGRRSRASKAEPTVPVEGRMASGPSSCTSHDLDRATYIADSAPEEERRYRCQITQLLEATTPLSPREPLQYLRDGMSGNVAWSYLLKIGILRFAARLVYVPGLRRRKIGLYDKLARAFGEPAWPYSTGRVEGRTPVETLDVKPGDYVTVKSHEEILDTLNDRWNRGLSFSPEMVRFCGKTFRVRARVEKILDEGTGQMAHFKSDCIILENVVCEGECSGNRLFCPRGIFPYWREIWLRRTTEEV